jgi:membrane protein implicated in regulation of membrane protease activity
MSWKKIGLVVLFADFVGFTAYAVYQHGAMEFANLLFSNAIGVQVALDLVIALSLVLVWLVRDARERGVSATPYVLLTLVAGSIGPLLYLILRREAAPARVGRATVAA